MADIYVDLSQVATGAGSSGSPYNLTQFTTDLAIVQNRSGQIYYVKGNGTIGSGNEVKNKGIIAAGSYAGKSVVIKGWAGFDPPRMIGGFEVFTNESAVFSGLALAIPNGCNGGLGGIYMNGNSGGANINMVGYLENCLIRSEGNTRPIRIDLNSGGGGGYGSFIMKGCTIYAGVGIPNAIFAYAYNDTGHIMSIDSCYFESCTGGVFSLNIDDEAGSAWAVKDYRYCAFYNAGSINDAGGSDAMIDGAPSHSIDQHLSLTSQITGLNKTVANMVFPTDLYPINESPIIDAGDLSLGLSTDIFGQSRGTTPDMGAAEWVVTATPINSFSTPPQRNGVPVVSTINRITLVSNIQSDYTDSYFDSTSKLGVAYLYFQSPDGRQLKKIIHNMVGSNLTGSISWSTTADDGTWTLNKVKAFDTDGATHVLGRASIGSDSDVALS